MPSPTTSSAPGKLMLFGEHAVVYGYPCIVTAVDERIFATISESNTEGCRFLTPQREHHATIQSIVNSSVSSVPKELQFVFAAVQRFTKQHHVEPRITISTKQAFASTFGFGSSSAVTVAVIHALSVFYGVALTQRELFDLAYACVLDVQGVGSGFDIAAAVWGGTLSYVTGGKRIVPLKNASVPLTVVYTGVKADTTSLVKKVAATRDQFPEVVEPLFQVISNIVTEAEKCIEARDWSRVGQLMQLNQGVLESLGVSSPEIHQAIDALYAQNAYGAKLSGAGGGDCVIALCPQEVQASATLNVLPATLHAQGVRTEA